MQVAIPPPRPRGRTITAWARVATLMAGADRGTWFPPAVGDEVVVAFDRGDQNRPLVIGSLWSQQAPPPEDDPAAQVRRFRSRSGAEIEFDDGPSAHVTLRTPGGGQVELDDDAGRILIGDDNGSAVVMDATGITIETASTVRVEGSGTVEVVAGLVKVEAGMTHFSGVVQADTVIAPNVLATTISPSAGNAW